VPFSVAHKQSATQHAIQERPKVGSRRRSVLATVQNGTTFDNTGGLWKELPMSSPD
jgi:hypothetical protein